MKTSIGIRVSPSKIFYCVVREEESNIELVLVDKVIVPKSLNTPEQLKFVRNTFMDILRENNVELACIRITESNARSTSIPRLYLEGVIQELLASSSVHKYYVGQISSISSKLGIERDNFKPFATGKTTFRDITIWNEIPSESRESILSSISALNL